MTNKKSFFMVIPVIAVMLVLLCSFTSFAECKWDLDNYNGFYGTWDQLSSKGTIYLYKGSSYKVGNKITVNQDRTYYDFTQKIKDTGPGTYHFTITDSAGRTWTSENCQVDENMLEDVGKLTWSKENGFWKLRDYRGQLLTGWQKVDGKWYYLDTKTGVCYTNTYTPDGYYVNSEGVWDGQTAISK